MFVAVFAVDVAVVVITAANIVFTMTMGLSRRPFGFDRLSLPMVPTGLLLSAHDEPECPCGDVRAGLSYLSAGDLAVLFGGPSTTFSANSAESTRIHSW
jgi:hypothetical protein